MGKGQGTGLSPTLLAIMDRIIPADDDGYPSASVNGVPDYLAHQLAPGGGLAHLSAMYDLGLAALDQEAQIDSARPFADLPPERQDAILARVESGDTAAHWPVPPERLFLLLVEHVSEGYYADPEHNLGNPDKASWRMIGFVERTGLPPGEPNP